MQFLSISFITYIVKKLDVNHRSKNKFLTNINIKSDVDLSVNRK